MRDSNGVAGWGPAPEHSTQKTLDVIFTHEANELVSGMSKCLELSGSPSKTQDSTDFFRRD